MSDGLHGRSKQLIGEVRDPLLTQPGRIQKYDSEYKRLGTANIFMAVEPLTDEQKSKLADERKTVGHGEQMG